MKTKYYIIDTSIDPKVVGSKYPQAYKFTKEYNPRSPHGLFSLYKCLNTCTFPDYVPDISGIKLSGGAKLTDIVSNGFDHNLIILSPKAKSILEQYNLCPHRFYDMSLFSRKVRYDYYMFHIQCDYWDYIDYEKSTFKIRHHSSMIGAPLSISSQKELLFQREIIEEKYDITTTPWAETLVLTSDFAKLKLDIFYIGLVDANLYISERMMNALLEQGITGWDFLPAVNFDIG